MKAARDRGKKANLVVDKLYIDGKQFKLPTEEPPGNRG